MSERGDSPKDYQGALAQGPAQISLDFLKGPEFHIGEGIRRYRGSGGEMGKPRAPTTEGKECFNWYGGWGGGCGRRTFPLKRQKKSRKRVNRADWNDRIQREFERPRSAQRLTRKARKHPQRYHLASLERAKVKA